MGKAKKTSINSLEGRGRNSKENRAIETAEKSKALALISSDKNNRKKKTVHDTYRKMSGTEHILHRPELYVGMIEPVNEIWWVPSPSNPDRMIRKNITYSPALFKIFDEIIVNAADNKMRAKELQTSINVNVNTRDGTISVFNDGPGIPIVRHNQHKLMIPHLIFGHLLTSSNYDDNESKVTGGRHGYGAKLTNVFSKDFSIETVNKGVYYQKTWSKNMSISHHEKINKCQGTEDYTRIVFKPDVARFGMKHIEDDIVHIFKRRAHDVAATCGVQVNWNGHKVNVSSFLDYARHFLPKKNSKVLISIGKGTLSTRRKLVQELINKDKKDKKNNNINNDDDNTTSSAARRGTDDILTTDIKLPNLPTGNKRLNVTQHQQLIMNRLKATSTEFTHRDCLIFHQKTPHWDVVLAFHLDGGVDKNDHICFVNNVATHNGGTHLRHVQEKVIDHLVGNTKPHMRKEISRLLRTMLQVFINAVIPNPTFGSQIKDKLITPESKFAATFNLHHQLKTAFHAAQLSKKVLDFAQRQLVLNNQKNAMKALNVRGRIALPKLEDANWAGSDKSAQCTLILTEGDSAKALAVSGLAVVGRDKFGVFPLKGKLMNARERSLITVSENEQFGDVMKAMGLRFDMNYDPKDPGLRYGRIMIMADQDHDGSHIKALLMNFINVFWPDLLQRPGFITQFITPIVKALPVNKKNDDGIIPRNFFSINDFNRWRNALSPTEQKKYSFKYYKGLGTSTAAEGREYFSHIDRHEIIMRPHPTQPKVDDMAFRLAFSSDEVESRKVWVSSYSVEDHVGIDFKKKQLSYSEFIHKELILFSVADCERSIPNFIDGLKPSQRKILFSCFKRNLTKAIKVEQLGGYISEQASYHHGEQSLHGAIVGLAQDYVGSNNLNLLMPDGQFGTRHESGKDHASARYIFTRLNHITRLLFPAEDDALLKYRDDDGFTIEPYFYVPIIPLVLVNGTSGIGTGFSTHVAAHHPLDVIGNVRRLLKNQEIKEMEPWYEGFTGHYDRLTDPATNATYYSTTNVVYIGSEKSIINIDDLAPGTSTSTIKNSLVALVKSGKVKDFIENHTPSNVSFTVEIDTGFGSDSIDADIMLKELERQQTIDKLEKKKKRLAILNQAADQVNMELAHQNQLQKQLDANVADIFHELTRRRTTFRYTNMYGFDRYGSLRIFESVDEIMKEHFEVRLSLYKTRHQHLLQQLEHHLEVEQSRMNFVAAILKGTLKLQTLRDEKALVGHLRKASGKFSKHFPEKRSSPSSGGGDGSSNNNAIDSTVVEPLQITDGKSKNNTALATTSNNNSSNEPSGPKALVQSLEAIIARGKESHNNSKSNDLATMNLSGYEYLTRMPISSFNQDHLTRITNKVEALKEEIKTHKKLTPIDLYKRDLDTLEEAVTTLYAAREVSRQEESPGQMTESSRRSGISGKDKKKGGGQNNKKHQKQKSFMRQEGKSQNKKKNGSGDGKNDDIDDSGEFDDSKFDEMGFDSEGVSRLARIASKRFSGSDTRNPESFAKMTLLPSLLLSSNSNNNLMKMNMIADEWNLFVQPNNIIINTPFALAVNNKQPHQLQNFKQLAKDTLTKSILRFRPRFIF